MLMCCVAVMCASSQKICHPADLPRHGLKACGPRPGTGLSHLLTSCTTLRLARGQTAAVLGCRRRSAGVRAALQRLLRRHAPRRLPVHPAIGRRVVPVAGRRLDALHQQQRGQRQWLRCASPVLLRSQLCAREGTQGPSSLHAATQPRCTGWPVSCRARLPEPQRPVKPACWPSIGP